LGTALLIWDSWWSGSGLIIGGLLCFFVVEDEERLRRDRDR
jgi:hypothetical protein